MTFDYPPPETDLGFGNRDSGTTRRHGGGTDLLASVTSRRFGLDRNVHDGTFPEGEVDEGDKTYTEKY